MLWSWRWDPSSCGASESSSSKSYWKHCHVGHLLCALRLLGCQLGPCSHPHSCLGNASSCLWTLLHVWVSSLAYVGPSCISNLWIVGRVDRRGGNLSGRSSQLHEHVSSRPLKKRFSYQTYIYLHMVSIMLQPLIHVPECLLPSWYTHHHTATTRRYEEYYKVQDIASNQVIQTQRSNVPYMLSLWYVLSRVE